MQVNASTHIPGHKFEHEKKENSKPYSVPFSPNLPQNQKVEHTSLRKKIFKTHLDKHIEFQELPKTPPRQDLKIEFQTKTQTYAHGMDFVLTEEGFIWFRERNNQEQDWKVLYFHGFLETTPVEIQADGANFIVIDDRNQLHYKKIMETELRVFEIEAKESKPPKKHSNQVHNASNAFAINKKGFIWVRSLSEEHPVKWYPFYFEGWPEKHPVNLELNGDKLTIHCSDGTTYVEDVSEKSLEAKLKGQHFPYEYHFFPVLVNAVAKDNWRPWFSLPGVSKVFNAVKGKQVKIPKDTVDYAISNRGHATGFVTGAAGEQHRVAIEVTTLYLRREGQNFISFSDPWLLPNDFEEHHQSIIYDKITRRVIGFKIEVPTNFQIEKFCASASTLFIHGKNTLTNENELYVRLVDYDTEGINPFLKYGSLSDIESIGDKDTIDPDIRFLPDGYKKFSPDQLWTPIPLDGLGQGVLERVDFKQMNIVQTGMGPQARDLFIVGTNAEGEKGYYKKSLSQKDESWVFFPFTNNEPLA